MEHKFHTAYGPHIKSTITFTGKGRTKQSHVAECDINQILAKYQKSGALTHLNTHAAQYGEATSQTFHDALNIVAKAQSMFEDLPSSIRTKFKNDPGNFLDFVQDPKNASELVQLGLATEAENNYIPEKTSSKAGASKAKEKSETGQDDPASGGEENTTPKDD